MGVSRQEYWSQLAFPSPEVLPGGRIQKKYEKHSQLHDLSHTKSLQFSSVAQSCMILCDPMASLSITNSWSPPKPMSIGLVMPSNHLILCHPLLLPSVFPNIRVCSNESVLRMRWPKYWSFSFSISSSNEHQGLISFRMEWLDLLAVQGTLKNIL